MPVNFIMRPLPKFLSDLRFSKIEFWNSHRVQDCQKGEREERKKKKEKKEKKCNSISSNRDFPFLCILLYGIQSLRDLFDTEIL